MEADELYHRMTVACRRVGRDPRSVRLLGASKKQPIEKVNAFIAYCNARGERALIGENYVQEWEEKREKIRGEYECHFIGHLQSNKAAVAGSLFSAIESVDSFKLAEKLSRNPRSTPLPVFLQVNISDDESKSGAEPGAAAALAMKINSLSGLQLSGLMTIPKLYQDKEKVRLDYRALKMLADAISTQIGRSLELSMGMSDDFEVAIEEGATIVRLGTVLFGGR